MSFFSLQLNPTSQLIAWFDVLRESEIGYREAKVIDVDFKSNLKRVKFHFWHLKKDQDEWIEIGSPRVAPHVSAICSSERGESFNCPTHVFASVFVHTATQEQREKC